VLQAETCAALRRVWPPLPRRRALELSVSHSSPSPRCRPRRALRRARPLLPRRRAQELAPAVLGWAWTPPPRCATAYRLRHTPRRHERGGGAH
jgi:hypothetical protein